VNEIDMLRMDAKLRALEEALDKAIERSRAAKQAAKQAKDDAKVAKKERKRARRALIEAQEEYGIRQAEPAHDRISDEHSALDRRKRPIGQQIADSPERRRVPRRKSKKRVRGSVVKVAVESPLSTTALEDSHQHLGSDTPEQVMYDEKSPDR
jgi:hypothetical protein